MRPEFKNKAKSVERAEALLEELNGPLDLICLPEMALIGYRFDDRADIEPYTEAAPADFESIINAIDTADPSTEESKTEALQCSFKWALTVSKKFSPAWVAVGFAERDSEGRFFNSALVVNHQLIQCHIVRKTLLYDDDKKWASTEESASGIEYNF